MKKDDICAAFCEPMDLCEVPIGYAIKTPFRRPDGDSVAVYLRRNPQNQYEYRVEDDGETIAFLEANGADLDSDTRFEALVSMLKEYDGFYSETESLIHTRFVPELSVPSLAVSFVALILRVGRGGIERWVKVD